MRAWPRNAKNEPAATALCAGVISSVFAKSIIVKKEKVAVQMENMSVSRMALYPWGTLSSRTKMLRHIGRTDPRISSQDAL